MHPVTRREFVRSAAAPALGMVVRPGVLGRGRRPPSETLGGALIGCGGRGPGTYDGMRKFLEKAGLQVELLARCDVRFADKADNQTIYADFRRVLERKDIDVVAIGTPPHWHALISIAAAEAGKDVLCEKPMTRFIAEGRAVVEAFRRYNRIFQIGTFGRFADSKDKNKVLIHKIMTSGLMKNCPGVVFRKGGFKVKEWSGRVNLAPQPPPKGLDWDFYVGPSPFKPFVRDRFGGTHRNYWDYEGGGLADMGQHHLEGFNWTYGKDYTSPVEIEAHAPVAHPEVTGMWGWVEMKYADGLTLVLESGEWGTPYDRKKPRDVRLTDLSEEDQRKIREMPDPEPLLDFGEAVRTRKPAGGHPEAAHRTACLLHLANLAIRTGRKIRYDPVKEQVIGDEEANRLVNQPMRAPWHL